ncbi:MAG TPA: hypothetical protein VK846_15840 [Candidatus Limnocylindria bacterium]|nr:hypothetical protein [Candidatus Limnocylindria bacterium]
MFLKSLALSLALALTSQAALTIENYDQLYTQDFDSLGTGSSSWTYPAGIIALPNWFSSEEEITAGNGSDTGAGLYNLGSGGFPHTGRSLGSVGGTVTFGIQFNNGTAGEITSMTVSYYGQTWRAGSAVNRLAFEYFVGDAGVVDSEVAGWVPVTALNYSSGLTGTEQELTANIEGLHIAAGQDFWFRWADSASPGADATLGIDDLTLTAVPETSFYSLAAVGFLGLVIAGRECRARFARRTRA